MEDKILITTEYINLQTDFGFKLAFGRPKNKRVLMRLLNALFEGKLTVTDVVYHDKERLPASKEGKRIVYDVYCTMPANRSDSPYFKGIQVEEDKGELPADHHFILEMQNSYVPPFEERITYYASKNVAEQGKAGWDYTLDPVFVIAVIDFKFPNMSSKMIRDVMLLDRESREPLTDKVHIIFCSLEKIPKNWEDCKTEIERVLFLIKNIDTMDSSSVAFREGKFMEFFEAARSNQLNPRETITYSESLERLRDIQTSIAFAEKKADRRYEEGRQEERVEIMHNMASFGMSQETIAQICGCSTEEVKRILKL